MRFPTRMLTHPCTHGYTQTTGFATSFYIVHHVVPGGESMAFVDVMLMYFSAFLGAFDLHQVWQALHVAMLQAGAGRSGKAQGDAQGCRGNPYADELPLLHSLSPLRLAALLAVPPGGRHGNRNHVCCGCSGTTW